MAFKFTVEAETTTESFDTLLDDMAQLTETRGEIESLIGQLPELDAVYDNLTSSIEALTNAKGADAVIRTLNVDGSLEALLGVAENAITVKAATEGLGLKLKYWWGKFVDWVKRVCRGIANFFRKLFGFTPKFSKEAEEVAKISGEKPEDVQKALDAAKSMARDYADKLGAVFDEEGFNKGFVEGCKLAVEARNEFVELGKQLANPSLTLADIQAKHELFDKQLKEEIDKLDKQISEINSKTGSSTESLIVTTVNVSAMQKNLTTIAKDASTNIPKWSKDLANNAEQNERVISASKLASMSADEIEEFYASGGKVEDPALYKALVACYKAIASGAMKLQSLLGRMLSKRVSVERAYVNMAKKVVSQAS